MFARILNFCRWGLLAAIIAAAGLLMLGAAQTDSAIVDEGPHITAGYSYLRYLDYRLNPEHPPLVKILAGLPLLFQNINFPTESEAWTTEINGQWNLAPQFLYESGNNADQIIFWARIGPILLTLITIVLIYILAAGIIGRWWAFLPAFLFAFSPTVLAHGHYVTTDIAATFGILLATLTFVNFLFKPSGKNLVWAGIAFGAAQLTKFSAALLVPFFALLMAVFFISEVMTEKKWSWLQCWRRLRSLILIFLIGYALVYAIYLILTLNYPASRQITDTENLLTTFTPRFLSAINIWLAQNPVTRPIAHYLLGLLMVLQRTAGGNTVYFLGEVSNAGWWYYFPVVFLMKEPIAGLIIIIAALAAGVWGFVKSLLTAIFKKSNRLLEYLGTRFPEFAMITFTTLYWAYSISTNLNIGIRHLLPTVPFIYILAAGAVKKWFNLEQFSLIRNFIIQILVLSNNIFGFTVKAAILSLLIIWYFFSSIVAYPHFISYFNLAAGGTSYGYKHVTDSNYDWGQDLRRLKSWVEQNLPSGGKIAIDYFGGGNVKYYLGEQAEPWWSARGNPKLEGINWLAVSINTIQGAKGRLTPNQERKPEDEYQWLEKAYEPYARAGKSIFIYKLDE